MESDPACSPAKPTVRRLYFEKKRSVSPALAARIKRRSCVMAWLVGLLALAGGLTVAFMPGLMSFWVGLGGPLVGIWGLVLYGQRRSSHGWAAGFLMLAFGIIQTIALVPGVIVVRDTVVWLLAPGPPMLGAMLLIASAPVVIVVAAVGRALKYLVVPVLVSAAVFGAELHSPLMADSALAVGIGFMHAVLAATIAVDNIADARRSVGVRPCPACGYDTGGIAGLECPECGEDRRGPLLAMRTGPTERQDSPSSGDGGDGVAAQSTIT